MKENEFKDMGMRMGIPYAEWKKNDLLERTMKIVPEIVEKWRKDVHKIDLSVAQIRSYINEVERQKRK